MKIITSDDDNFLYERLLNLLNEVKLVQGGTALSSTLRRHNKIKFYLISKQIDKIQFIEKKYFNDDGSLNHFEIENHLSHVLRSRQINNNGVH